MKERFIELLLGSGRENIEDLIRYLDEKTDFFSAPASTRFHGACESGLLEHSLAVYDNLCRLAAAYELPFSTAEVTICALLHDVCKVNFYKRGSRNRKNPVTGAWEQVPVYEIEDLLPLGHGEKSVMLLQQYIWLSREEMLAIRWHMGGFDDSASGMGRRALSQAMSSCSLVTALHMADLAACYFDEK
ncbi:MAG: HD domain-containing protein [Selenomonadaceae bacterium]